MVQYRQTHEVPLDFYTNQLRKSKPKRLYSLRWIIASFVLGVILGVGLT